MWLDQLRRLRVIAQNGLTYSRDDFHRERFSELERLVHELEADSSGLHDLAHVPLEPGHATPKLDVRSFVVVEDKVLFVRGREDHRWTLPGGWIDVGESPSEAAEREVLEESGYTVRAYRLLAVYDRLRHDHPPMLDHVYKLFFDCRLVGGESRPSSETDAVQFYPVGCLPELSTAPVGCLPELSTARVTDRQIQRLWHLHRCSDAPTDFD